MSGSASVMLSLVAWGPMLVLNGAFCLWAVPARSLFPISHGCSRVMLNCSTLLTPRPISPTSRPHVGTWAHSVVPSQQSLCSYLRPCTIFSHLRAHRHWCHTGRAASGPPSVTTGPAASWGSCWGWCTSSLLPDPLRFLSSSHIRTGLRAPLRDPPGDPRF